MHLCNYCEYYYEKELTAKFNFAPICNLCLQQKIDEMIYYFYRGLLITGGLCFVTGICTGIHVFKLYQSKI